MRDLRRSAEISVALITELAASLVGRTILSVWNTTRTGLSVLVRL